MRNVILLALIFCVSTSYSEILFEENFESGKIDKAKWTPQGTWVIKANADDHDELGKHVIEIQGGDVGLSVDDFPKEFDYYADFKAMQNGLTGFVFHGKDAGNIYMHQVSTSSSGHTPQHIRWHRRVGGGWAAEPGPFKDGEDRDPNVWYRVKFEVRIGHNFKAYIGPIGGENDELSFVSEWTDSQKSFTSGKIGFRMSGGEQAQYDNIVVSTPDFDIFSVEPNEKIALTWGSLKSK